MTLTATHCHSLPPATLIGTDLAFDGHLCQRITRQMRRRWSLPSKPGGMSGEGEGGMNGEGEGEGEGRRVFALGNPLQVRT